MTCFLSPSSDSSSGSSSGSSSSNSNSSKGSSAIGNRLTLSPYMCKALAGTGSGIVATALCSPLDVAKTRIQVQKSADVHRSGYSGILQSLATIYRHEGLAGWYHGFTPAVCSVAVFWTVYFPCYDYSKERIALLSGLPASSPLVHMSAAAGAGLVTDVITNPLWVIRTRLATQALRLGSGPEAGALQYKSMRHAFRRILVEEGPMAFFAGLSASILGLSHIMIQFPLYEKMKAELLLGSRSGSSSSNSSSNSSSSSSNNNSSSGGGGVGGRSSSSTGGPIWHIIAASGLSKLVASTVTYPHEVIRARLQNDQGGRKYAGLVDATLQTYRSEGIGALWLGFRINIVRTIPQSIVTFTMYEALSTALQRRMSRSKISSEQPQQHQHQHEHMPAGVTSAVSGAAAPVVAKPVHVERMSSIHVIARTRSEARG